MKDKRTIKGNNPKVIAAVITDRVLNNSDLLPRAIAMIETIRNTIAEKAMIFM